MSSLLSCMHLYLVVGQDGVHRHGFVAHNGVIFGHHHQRINVELLQLLVRYRVFIEYLLGRWVSNYLRSQVSVELHQVLRTFNFLHIHEPSILPKLHLGMLEHSFLNVSFDEELLVDCSHVLYYFSDIDRSGQGHQSLHIKPDLLPQQIAQEIVASKACADQVDLRGGVVLGDAFQGSFQLCVFQSSEGDGTGHFIIEAPAIQADTAVAFLGGRLHKLLNIIILTPTRQTMHHKQNGGIWLV